MKTAPGSPASKGFALVVTLSLMILLTIIAVGLLTLSSISLRSSSQGEAMSTARANARLALMLAMGELQKSAGPDQRITAAADILPASKPATPGHAQWAGVWDTSTFSPAKPDTKAFVRWLVSDSPSAVADATATAGTDDVLLFTGKDAASSVRVPKIKVTDNNTNGYYAYWVADEGLKADLGWSEGKFTTAEHQQSARLTAAPGPDYGSFAGPFSGKPSYPLTKTAGNPWLDHIDKALSTADMPLVMSDPTNQSTWLNSVRHDVTLDSTGNVGQFTSLELVNGNPAISYYDITNTNLKYVRANDVSGTTWSMPVTLDSAGNVGQHTSLTVVNSNPAVGYYDVTNTDLKYVRANDANGTVWNTPVAADIFGSVGRYASLAVVNGNPAISYYDSTSADLKYVRANNVTGTSWAAPLTLDNTGSVGQHTSLAVVNGNPAISYYDATNGELKFLRTLDTNGTGWSMPFTIHWMALEP